MKKETPETATILIVDDTPDNLRVLIDLLEASGFETRVATNGRDAVRIADLVRPSVILLDILMPEMDGFETCTRIKAHPDTADIPVIFLSALADTENIVRGFEAGGVDYITKPFRREEVLARLRAHVTIRAQQRELTALNRRLNREVEQRKQTSITLAESEERLNEAQSLSDMGSWQWDMAADETVWSQNMYRLLGYTPGEVTASMDGFKKHVHPDDLNKVSTIISTCIHKQNPFQVEYRFFRVDGEMRYARAVGEVACGIDAKPVQIHATFQDITEQKRQEKELKLVHERLDNILKYSPNVISIFDEQGRYLHINPAGQQMLALPEENILGTSCRDLLPEEVADTFLERIHTVLKSESVLEVEDQFQIDAREHIFSTTLFPIYGNSGPPAAVGGIAMDITRRKQAEKALEESREWYRALFESVADAIFVHPVMPDGTPGSFIEVNEAACRLLGYSREELLKRTVYDIDVSESEVETGEILQKLSQRESIAYERVVAAKDGRRIPVELHAKPVGQKGERPVLAILRDLTERKKAEDARLQMERRLQTVQRLESLGVMAGGIAHDFNNLLMVMQGNIEIAKEGLSGETREGMALHASEAAIQQAADLVRQLLAYTGKGHFIVEPVDIGKMIQEVSDMLRSAVPATVKLHYDLPADLPKVEGDTSQLRQLLSNLVANAAESYDENRGGVVTISAGDRFFDEAYLSETVSEVWMGYDPPFSASRFVFIEVKDRGGGMDAANRKRIFEPFYTTKFQGRGLGLAAVLGIVRGLKGYIRIDSEPNRGTAVRVLLPVGAEQATVLPEKEAAPPSSSPAEFPTGAGLILLVDDDAQIRHLVQRMLERLGYDTVCASGGAAALEIFKEKRDSLDLVLCDLSMPGMSGIEVLENLRALDAAIPVILSSGYSEDDLKDRYRNKGFSGFLQKPYRMKTLGRMVEEVLK